MTKIEQFRMLHNVKPGALARASKVSVRTIELIRKGQNTTLDTARALAFGFSKILRRNVSVSEIFDLSTGWTPLPTALGKEQKAVYDAAA